MTTAAKQHREAKLQAAANVKAAMDCAKKLWPKADGYQRISLAALILRTAAKMRI